MRQVKAQKEGERKGGFIEKKGTMDQGSCQARGSADLNPIKGEMSLTA